MSLPFICVLLVATFLHVSTSQDFTQHCYRCKCVWSSGKPTADCSNIEISEIPRNLSTKLRDIDFSNNPLYQLRAKEFLNAQLQDVHKLKLINCRIEAIHQTAFHGLGGLIELDLSNNSITTLHKDLFHDILRIRVLSLSYNNISILPENLFYNLTHLQRINLKNNKIAHVSPKVFVLLPVLQDINLANNRLTQMMRDFTQDLTRVNSLHLEGNPWYCDCHLEEFRQKVIKNSLVTQPTMCAEPPRLSGSSWNNLSVVFACPPVILDKTENAKVEADSSNFTLTCKVDGNPPPEIDWILNGNKVLDRNPRSGGSRYHITKQQKGTISFSSLSIINVSYRDRGEYRCLARNAGGTDSKNITLFVNCEDCGSIPNPTPLATALPLILGLSISAVLLLLIIILILVCCCKKSSRTSGKRHDLSQSSEFIGLDGRPEMEKALITEVNPVVKPPRQHTITTATIPGGTEVSELNKMLDGDSVFGDEESRSYDFDNQTPSKHVYLPNEVDYREHQYPPDLLSFPPRNMQVSPAGSQASTVADTSRLQPMAQPSPLGSPMYEALSLYRTLPSSRSQSPFIAMPRYHRQGAYVTIPRRPRQSWSSEPPTSEVAEPLYDNLGKRSTAGGSTKSLNTAFTPKSNRSFPLSPIGPIVEQDSPPTAMTLPRPTTQNSLSPVWTNYPGLLENHSMPRKSPESSRDDTPKGKVHKIPPQPPPKPKKRTNTGPLFEDEGEDGTEV